MTRQRTPDHICGIYCLNGIHVAIAFHYPDCEDETKHIFERKFAIEVLDVRRVEAPVPERSVSVCGGGEITDMSEAVPYGVTWRDRAMGRRR